MRLRWIGVIVVSLVLLTSAACVGAVVALGITQADVPTGDHVAVIEIHGPIMSSDPGGLFAANIASAERIVEQLDQIRDDSSVKAVVLDINTPGGGVVASEQIYEAVLRVQDEGTPVIAYFGDTAASGGYFISASADQIVANPATITGSIGVISQIPNMEELFDKIGVELQTIQTGEFKDMMQPSRPLTEAEREIIGSILDESYERFVEIIVDGRDLSETEVRELADGRIYSGRQAAENGLVDVLGDERDAISLAGELSGLGDDPDVRDYTPSPDFWDVFVGFTSGEINLPFSAPFGIDIDPREMHLEINYGSR